jgi:membrane fusion protein, heavy metal efflux system
MQGKSHLLTLGAWSLALCATFALLAGLYWLHQRNQNVGAAEAEKPARKLVGGAIKLGEKFAASLGITEKQAKEIAWVPKVAIYGRVVPNPRATTEIRAPVAGRLRNIQGVRWPAIASHVKAGDLFGHLEARVEPRDQVDLLAKHSEAEQRVEGAKKILRVNVDRVKRFESAPQSFARSDLDSALVALAEAETQLATSEAALRLWRSALAAIDQRGDAKNSTWVLPLTAPAEGEVTELLGQPDMVVEPGSVIARVVDFTRALVRLDIPLRYLASPPPKALSLDPLQPAPPALQGPTNRPEPPETPAGISAHRVGVTAQVDPVLQAVGYLYEVDLPRAAAGSESAAHLWRPGLFVKALMDIDAAKPVPAVAVPNTALLYHQGRALVYVRLSPGRYQRREVTVLGRSGDSWILGSGVDADEWVVNSGALALLSEEFRADVDDD